jgi:hypothetical protein
LYEQEITISKAIQDALGRLDLSLLILDGLPVSNETKEEVAEMFVADATKKIGNEVNKLEQEVKRLRE